ncbi:MAG: YbaK/EbsC family protein [Anaerolineae bacterium]|jgi:prolyl-tRNA editing enzyme YbaK/EbsC (Cys-tRNA(Pro) deacylase)|nr:YbaK/EbsC family protein [Anaerolineae bacterium]
MQPLTPEAVGAVLAAFDPSLKIMFFEVSTATSELAAAAIGCQVGQIAKSICFMVEGQPLIVVTSGDRQVDDRKVAALLNVGRKKVKMATPDECLRIFGYVPGSVPPVAHRTAGIKLLLDATLQRHTMVYPAAGSASACFGLTVTQLAALTGGTFADVVRDSGGETAEA